MVQSWTQIRKKEEDYQKERKKERKKDQSPQFAESTAS